ncbi:MAG: type II secretion system protein, partial [bacterium]
MKKQKGFTLVELLVVIAIIGLLSTIAFISLNRARAKARDAKRISDVRELQ